nr:hypothetical protein [Cereibacter sphaeroides]
MTSTAVTTFDFNRTPIHTLTMNEELWFVWKEVCEAIGLDHVYMAVRALADHPHMTVTKTTNRNLFSFGRGTSRLVLIREWPLQAGRSQRQAAGCCLAALGDPRGSLLDPQDGQLCRPRNYLRFSVVVALALSTSSGVQPLQDSRLPAIWRGIRFSSKLLNSAVATLAAK